jgi:UDP-N-acetylmuramoyl-tripeptide--D-alanyl-D-alanine ligase
MRVLWTDAQLREATGGITYSTWQAGRVVIDSRTVQEGDLFVAIRGQHRDGHAYVAQALAKGAAAAIIQYMPPDVESTAKLVTVPDTTKALWDLAIHARARCHAKVIAITGSVGKTGTKDGLAVVLAGLGKIHVTTGNLNNHYGVPLTLANMPENTQYAIIEMGMNHAGEIRALTKLVRPHVAVITAIQPAHMEFFDSVEQVSDAKVEIAEGLEPYGTLLLPADSNYFSRMKQRAHDVGVEKILGFGEAADADYRLMMYRIRKGASEVHAMVAGRPVSFKLGAIGYHWGVLSLAIAAVVDVLRGDWNKAVLAFPYVREPAGRGRLSQLSLAGQRTVMLVDDSYNASPAAMRAGFAKLRDVFDMMGAQGRMVAVLGDMLELGADGPAQHVDLAEQLVGKEVELVVCVGALMRHLYDALPADGALQKLWVADAKAALPLLLRELADGDTVLVKGSHGSHLYQLVEALCAQAQEKVADAV